MENVFPTNSVFCFSSDSFKNAVVTHAIHQSLECPFCIGFLPIETHVFEYVLSLCLYILQSQHNFCPGYKIQNSIKHDITTTTTKQSTNATLWDFCNSCYNTATIYPLSFDRRHLSCDDCLEEDGKLSEPFSAVLCTTIVHSHCAVLTGAIGTVGVGNS